MFIIGSNTYKVNQGGLLNMDHIVTGFVGVFDTKDRFEEAWNDTLEKVGVPKRAFKNHHPNDIGGTWIFLDEDNAYTTDFEKAAWVVELMSKETELNKILTVED